MSKTKHKKFHKSRIIAKIEIKSKNCVKPIQFEGLKKVGDPVILAKKYELQGVDEIIMTDIVASLYQREIDYDLIYELGKNISIPLTYGGRVKNLNQFENCLKKGADKISLNSGIINNLNLLKKIINTFGSQAVIINIEAQKIKDNWFCLTDGGRINSGRKLLSWINTLKEIGIGELLIQSIRKDGTLDGPDYELIQKVSKINISKIYCGGICNYGQINKIHNYFKFDAVALSSVLHYNKIELNKKHN